MKREASVGVLILDKKYLPREAGLRKAALKILRLLKKSGRVEIYVIGDLRMRRLNKKFRKLDRPTNVLSFPEPSGFPHPPKTLRPLGEIYLDLDYIEKKEENVVKMLAHGILHLAGYDHKKIGDRIKMEKKEKILWRKMSLPD
ncbi:MAG: rRNA maturation RNase YbeY [Parcubacteria group bacterium]|nr:rRNA maturation RNase YbeY [Parcubacteria group bacterium]